MDLIGRQAAWLRMSYYSLQLLLYRSFIHYATPATVRDRRNNDGEAPKGLKSGLAPYNPKYYNYATKCLNAARATLRTADNVHKGTRIRSAYWVRLVNSISTNFQFTMYSIFTATIILLFCVIQNPSDSANDELVRDAEYGQKMIQELAGRSLTAKRCCALINVSLPPALISRQELFTVLNRVKEKVENEKDKMQQAPAQKRSASEDKFVARSAQRRRSSQTNSTAVEPSSTAISPVNASHPMTSNIVTSNTSGVAGGPTSSFTPFSVIGYRPFTPQSQTGTGSSPAGSDLVHPFAVGQQGIYTSFENSPPSFPLPGQQQSSTQMSVESVSNDYSAQFWQGLFGPPGSSLPLLQHNREVSQQSARQSDAVPNQTAGEPKHLDDVNNEDRRAENSSGVNLEEIDSGLVDWGDFIAQCSQVWVTE